MNAHPDTAAPISADAMYRLLVQGVTDYAIYMLDKGGFVANWNAGAERAKGYRAAEIVGQHFSCFYTEADRKAGRPSMALEVALATGKFEGQGWRVKKDGTRFWANVVIHPVKDDGGQFIGFAKITRDLSQLRAIEEQAANQEQVFRLLVQSVTDYAIYMLNPDGTVANWNIGARRAKGYTAEEIVGQHFSRFYTEPDREAGLPTRALEKALTEGKFEGEGWRLRKDGARFWAHVVIDPIYDDHGRHIGFAKITRDMSDKKFALEQERVFRLLVQGVTDYAIYMLNPDGTVANWNVGAERAKGYAADEIIGQHFSRFYTEEDRKLGLPEQALATALSSGKFDEQGWRLRKDGKRFWAHVVIDPIYDEASRLIGFAKITRDLSEQKRQADELREIKDNLDLALTNMSQGLVLFDAQERVVLCNQRMRDMLGLAEDALKRGTTLTEILREMYADPALPPEEMARKLQAMRVEHLARIEASSTGGGAELMWRGRAYALNHSRMPNDGGWVTTMEDVTERRVIEDRISHLAHHDVLTSLPNRMTFRDHLETALAEASDHTATILYVDLDRFKPINDTLGHPVGDAVLKVVAERMQAQMRRHDIVARLGGDEFAVLLGDHATVQDAQLLANRLVREISRPMEVFGLQVAVGASVGIAMSPDHGTDPDVLLRNADLALYRAKEAGRGCHRFYESGMELVMRERQELERDLRNALSRGEFSLNYQPVVETFDGELAGFEALLRWKSATRGQVSPVDFIPFAEEIGMMPEIGEWVLQRACREALSWPAHLKVSVNLSPTQFVMPDLVERIHAVLTEVGLPAERLELEITETAMIGDVPAAAVTLGRLRALGILIAMDDFGTGYSSLSFLRAMPLTRIKIDRSFVQDLSHKPEALAIVRAVVDMSGSIGVAVTAEGVETEDQASQLRKAGCPAIQGYLISHPRPAAEISGWIATYQDRNDPTAGDDPAPMVPIETIEHAGAGLLMAVG